MIKTHLVCLTAVWFGVAGSGLAEIKLPEPVYPTPRQERPSSIIQVPAPIDAETKLPEPIKPLPRQERPALTKKMPAPVNDDRVEQPRQINTPQHNRLLFFNEDRLRGRLVSVLPGEPLIKWRHPGVGQPISLNLESVSAVDLAARVEANAREPGDSVWLTNDDMLTGKVVSLDDRELILDTWYAGRLRIVRPMIRAIRSKTSAPVVLYSGVTDLGSWTIGSRHEWKLRNNHLVSSPRSSIGRSIPEMPDVASIEFEVDSNACARFAFSFYSDKIESEFGNCYSLEVMSESSGYLSRSGTKYSGNKNMGFFEVPRDILKLNNEKRKYGLLVNKPAKSISLMVNRKLVKEWVDKDDFAGRGDGILFHPECESDMRFGNIRVAKWDGIIRKEQAAGAPLTDGPITNDIIRLPNKDMVTGQLLGIADGKVSFKSAYVALSVPLMSVEEIQFCDEHAEPVRRNKTDIRGTFVDTGSITIGLSKIEDNRVVGTSEIFGEVSIPLHCFKKIEFNIYRKPRPKPLMPPTRMIPRAR